MSDRTDYYAEAFFQVIAAEGRVNEVQDELFRFARVLESSDELREALTDPHVPVARRQQIVEDLLQDKATDATLSLVSMIVALGRIRELPAIVDKLLARTAELSAKTVAEVRSAVELTEDQKQRLAAALKRSTGRDVEVVVIVDPTVMGGLVTQIGDTVIDGSVRHRLAQLRESF
ncbi:MAG: ATP synthase F1 subunit delta [Acidimicrobiales bacterium]|jgi:F-type H+-transporting ATPase subunit delta|nr:ATP synthase F1 subunit delta [Acidimicrobiales bacterium]